MNRFIFDFTVAVLIVAVLIVAVLIVAVLIVAVIHNYNNRLYKKYFNFI